MDSKDLLIKYMVESFDQNHPSQIKSEGKPFITISRDHGCQGNTLAIMLRDELQRKGQKWNILNKEIIMESAKLLDMEPRRVKDISESVDRTLMDEVLRTLTTKYYKSDRKIRQTVSSVITSAASEGNAIIVGRAGAALTYGLQKSIHIKLFAPVEWRIQSLMSRYHASREHLVKDINSIDLKRHKLITSAYKGVDDIDMLYDIHFNTSTVTHQEIVAVVLRLIEERFKK